jgi:peptide deformylase
VPATYDKVTRHAQVTVRALGRDGQTFELDAEGLTAVCIQHEMDHLVGRVFVEYLSALKRDRIRTRMLKRARESQRA